MDIFIAICCDRHIDEVVRVYTTASKAVEGARNFVSTVSRNSPIEEPDLTHGMLKAGWVFYATYGSEGDSVRVEKGQLDPVGLD